MLLFSSSIATEHRLGLRSKSFVTNISAAVVEDGTTAKISVREFFLGNRVKKHTSRLSDMCCYVPNQLRGVRTPPSESGFPMSWVT